MTPLEYKLLEENRALKRELASIKQEKLELTYFDYDRSFPIMPVCPDSPYLTHKKVLLVPVAEGELRRSGCTESNRLTVSGSVNAKGGLRWQVRHLIPDTMVARASYVSAAMGHIAEHLTKQIADWTGTFDSPPLACFDRKD